MSKAIGIDLGTTYSAVSVLSETGQPQILLNQDGENLTPSVVFFQDFDGNDEPLVGIQAKNLAASSPEAVVQYVKRQMGNPNWKFDSPSDTVYTAEEISAIILKRLKEGAENALGDKVEDVVITVPAYFDDARRTATKHAGEIAGLNVLRVLNEPTAAALAYGISAEKNETVLVYDLGGGTFDVTLMKIKDGEFDVIATDGDRNLGGFDFDNALSMIIAEKMEEQGAEDIYTDEHFTALLREKSENTKRGLTTVEKTNVFLDYKGKSYKIPITRVEFEEATKDLGKVDFFDVADEKENGTVVNEDTAKNDIAVQSDEAGAAVQDRSAAVMAASEGDAPVGELTVTGIVKQGVINGIQDKTPIYVRIFDENWNELEYQELQSGDSYTVTASSGSGI